MLAGERLTQPHRTHTYQRLCDAGWSHQRVTLATGSATAALSLLGAASLAPYPSLRAAADLAAAALIALYLRSPALLGSPCPARPGRPCTAGRPDVRTLIVSHYFPPEAGAPQERLSALAAAWAAAGDEVTVLTGMPNHPTGVLAPEYRRAVRRRERCDGYAVAAHLAVRDAERGHRPQDAVPSELHGDQRAARLAGQRPG